MSPNLKKFFEDHFIQYKLFTHEALFTCEDAEKVQGLLNSIPAKSLLIKDKDSDTFFLAILPANVRLDMKSFSEKVGVKKLRFATPEELFNILGLTPGSVTPFGLINDTEKKVKLFLHEEVWNSEKVQFHPNVNTETVEMTHDEFERCLKLLGVEYSILS